MSLQYSTGTLINRTFTPAVRVDLVNNITQALSDAGWTTISGTPGNAGTVLVSQESAVGNQGQKARVLSLDPGSGTCAQFNLRHSSGSPTSQIFYCNPINTWRVIATKFHFFAFMTGAANRTTGRGFICGGILWVPTFIALTAGDAMAWMMGTAVSDTDATARCSWRTCLRPYDLANSGGRFSGIYVNTLAEMNTYSSQAGSPSLGIWQGGYYGNAGDSYLWEDLTLPIYEPLAMWMTGTNSASPARIKGQLYDAAIVNGSFSSEAQITFDGHTWLAVTDSSASVAAATNASLFLAIA